jgi:hypothetical protein
MFEYLKPLLVMPTYDRTLLDETYRAVVDRQIAYGRERGAPWGVSESGYNKTDLHLNYQYRAFGVPGLGFKRGLADDLVVAPYACVMGLMVAPDAACRTTITSGCIASMVRTVSLSVSPLLTLDDEPPTFTTSALKRLPASSNDVRVRVDAS